MCNGDIRFRYIASCVPRVCNTLADAGIILRSNYKEPTYYDPPTKDWLYSLCLLNAYN